MQLSLRIALLACFFSILEATLKVIPVENPTHKEYQCVSEGTDAATTNYTWYRQGWNTIPEGVKSEGDRLHFLKSSPALNGLYICEAINRYGVATASLYKYTKNESLLRWILNKANPQVVSVILINETTNTAEYQCVVEANAGHTKYSWRRQDWNTLPEGVEAEGDRLHFRKLSSDLEGLYICEVENQLGRAAGSVYRYSVSSRHQEM